MLRRQMGDESFWWPITVGLLSACLPWARRSYVRGDVGLPELTDLLIGVVVVVLLEGGRRYHRRRNASYEVYRHDLSKATETERALRAEISELKSTLSEVKSTLTARKPVRLEHGNAIGIYFPDAPLEDSLFVLMHGHYVNDDTEPASVELFFTVKQVREKEEQNVTRGELRHCQ